jgi:membrane dipeptidase
VTWIWDGHNDYAWEMRKRGYDLAAHPFDQPVPELQTDLPRLRMGGVGAQFWSVFVPCSYQGSAAVTATLEQIAFIRRLTEQYPDDLMLATSAAHVESAVETGRIACLMGMEGGHQIDASLEVLTAMFTLGVRYLTLTHNDNVPWADSATDMRAVGGLNEFGRTVVSTMNRLGMFVDLSHVSAEVMRDALDATAAPVVFSHSSSLAVCDHPRNVPDEILARLPANGGVCMVTFVPGFVSQQVREWVRMRPDEVDDDGTAPKATLDHVVEHCEHVREVAGIEHIGLGGDYDGTATLPRGLGDVSGYPRLLDALRANRWSDSDLDALAHGNVLRAMRDMESVAVRQ